MNVVPTQLFYVEFATQPLHAEPTSLNLHNPVTKTVYGFQFMTGSILAASQAPEYSTNTWNVGIAEDRIKVVQWIPTIHSFTFHKYTYSQTAGEKKSCIFCNGSWSQMFTAFYWTFPVKNTVPIRLCCAITTDMCVWHGKQAFCSI